jgi:hypothetical protein
LLDFNEKLINGEYGAIRISRLLPPKKFIGRKVGDFVTQRTHALQVSLNAIVADEETYADPIIHRFFKLME